MSQENVQQNPSDPFAPDAPTYHLLSIRHNPDVANMSQQQLADLVKRIRAMATSPQTLTSALQRESGKRKSKPLTPEEIKRRQLLESL